MSHANAVTQAAAESAPLEALRGLDARLPLLDRRELARELAPLVVHLHAPMGAQESEAMTAVVMSLCRRLYGDARSGDALPLAQALLVQAGVSADEALERRASSLCGLLAADTGDVVGAIAYHSRALALAQSHGDLIEQGGTWANIGLAFAVAGNHELAVRCYRRTLALVDPLPRPVYCRYTACANLANALYQLGDFAEGLRMARLALQELTPEALEKDIHGAILQHRNLVRLLIASGRTAEAAVHVSLVASLASRVTSRRALIAASLTRAAYELATGHSDIALTRLEDALEKARSVPAALRDTLSFVVRAEEAAGNVERALVRFEELSAHVYQQAIDRARDHVELAGLWESALSRSEHQQVQARARLVSSQRPRGEPEEWKALQRLAMAASFRIDDTGLHGVRVGELTKALAIASGVAPLEALEIGCAAELHDIGLSSVPEAILAKRGELNEVERAIVERHTDAGAEILRDDSHPRILLARDIAKYHHAHWDGSGYPERVGREFIPPPARMCAVADAYDAMVCGLRHREPMTMNGALSELRRGAGGQFDPYLVDRFETVIRDETADRGIDPSTMAGLEDFQQLVLSLQEDRGYI